MQVLLQTNLGDITLRLYDEYVSFEGTDKTSNVVNEREFSENYCELLPKLESLLEMSIIKQYPVPASMLREDMVKNYP